MKAVLKVNLKAPSPEEGQRILLDLCEKMKRDGRVDEYHFEITTPHGPVTEKCLLSDQKVVA
jgi:predicted AlkP superfamily pyrophosphatase or phosphodiesterase